MKCSEARELLITDFLDNEISPESERQLAEHLASCQSCKEYEQTLIKTAVEPFKAVKRESPPSYIWQNIQNGIENRNTADVRNPAVIMKGWLTFPRVALAASLCGLLILASALIISNQRKDTYIADSDTFSAESAEEAGESYFSYLYEEVEITPETDSVLGTAAEELILGRNARNFIVARIV
ncbi:MAG: zf-HC2 domain-containing protein [Elusimicrobiota bacterium]